MTNEEKTAAMQLFEIKALIRAKIEECEEMAQKAKQPQTQKWYRFFAHELELLMKKSLGIVYQEVR